MKKGVLFASGAAAVAVVGMVAAFLYCGNQPQITYYPDGEMKTFIERKFFIPNGWYKIYNENGALTQKYTMINGKKNGVGYLYADGLTLKLNFADGKLSGSASLKTKLPDTELEKYSTRFNPAHSRRRHFSDTELETYSAEFKDGGYVLRFDDGDASGKITCSEDDFLNYTLALMNNRNYDNFAEFSGCLSLNDVNLQEKNGDVFCKFEGDYQYPYFKKDSSFACQYTTEKVTLEYAANDKKSVFKYDGERSDSNIDMNISFSGLEQIIEAFTKTSFDENNNHEEVVMQVQKIFENLTFFDSDMTSQNQKIIDFIGSFNFVKGLSSPASLKLYGTDNKVLASLDNDSDMSFIVNYPISGKAFAVLDVEFGDNFSEYYRKSIENLFATMAKFSDHIQYLNMLETENDKLLDKAKAVYKSISGKVFNPQGEKLLEFVIEVDQNKTFAEMAENLGDGVTCKITAYKNNAVYKEAIGNIKGFAVDGKTVDVDDLADCVDEEYKDLLMQALTNLQEEYLAIINADDESTNPFVLGMRSGYNRAMATFNSARLKDQVALAVASIRILYASQNSYLGLNTPLAIQYNVFASPETFDVEGQTKVFNADGGLIEVAASDEGTSFVVTLNGLSDDACRNLAEDDWSLDGSNQSFLGLSVNGGEYKINGDFAACSNASHDNIVSFKYR
ncbi:MAG: hypothetical protein IJ689_06135 [Alphaproteobacteria bacterium]|nr:hypothetical protein [Alphaproteobacteria bacterium]